MRLEYRSCPKKLPVKKRCILMNSPLPRKSCRRILRQIPGGMKGTKGMKEKRQKKEMDRKKEP